jgi:uncharacterized BrkB/YihY/UPF0761 family membrane protein
VGNPPTEPEPRGSSKVVRAARARVDQTWERVEAARGRVPAIDAAFDVRTYDQEVGGGLLAGAIAFRLFLFIVPFAFVTVLALGWVADGSGMSPADVGKRFGMAGIVASSIGEASSQNSTSRFLLLLVGSYALYLASLGAVRAIRVAHILAWRMEVARFRGGLKAALWFAGAMFLIVFVTDAVNVIRESRPGPGLVLLLLLGAFVGGIWLVASWKLPHPAEIEVRELVPGAVLVAVGVEALHLLTVLWYSNKIAHSSELYGSLGAAVGLLAWLYLLGRLTIASVVLNATLWRRRHAGPVGSDDPSG